MEILIYLLLGLVLVAVLLLVLLLRRDPAARLGSEFETRLGALRQDLERVERSLREEHRGGRGELHSALTGFDARLGQFTERTETGLGNLRQNLGDDARRAREEGTLGLQRFGEGVQGQLAKLTETNERRLGEIRVTLEGRLKDIQQDNAAKLEQMRQTVDEKLQSTLETRLGESFRQVSERLEQVHRGLGEMQSLAAGVGDLKRVLGNVKTRGIFGEVQLGAILDQILTPEQFAANVATRPGSAERVEFAVRLPGTGGTSETQVWLPMDAKFPREDYERLLDAQERADGEAAAVAGLALERRIRDEGKAIAQKYIEPPHTTDFALLFLPTEGLYAEVLRRPGLAEAMQRDHRIVIAGPSTLSALLNSLRMGFRTLAIEQRSSEVWQVLGAVKTEFGKFAGVLDKTQKKLREATNIVESAGVRTRAIERRLRGVEASTSEESLRLLGDIANLPAAEADGDAEQDETAE